MELNLDNPIFVIYVNVSGISRARAESQIAQLSDNFKYDNAIIWIMVV